MAVLNNQTTSGSQNQTTSTWKKIVGAITGLALLGGGAGWYWQRQGQASAQSNNQLSQQVDKAYEVACMVGLQTSDSVAFAKTFQQIYPENVETDNASGTPSKTAVTQAILNVVVERPFLDLEASKLGYDVSTNFLNTNCADTKTSPLDAVTFAKEVVTGAQKMIYGRSRYLEQKEAARANREAEADHGSQGVYDLPYTPPVVYIENINVYERGTTKYAEGNFKRRAAAPVRHKSTGVSRRSKPLHACSR